MSGRRSCLNCGAAVREVLVEGERVLVDHPPDKRLVPYSKGLDPPACREQATYMMHSCPPPRVAPIPAREATG